MSYSWLPLIPTGDPHNQIVLGQVAGEATSRLTQAKNIWRDLPAHLGDSAGQLMIHTLNGLLQTLSTSRWAVVVCLSSGIDPTCGVIKYGEDFLSAFRSFEEEIRSYASTSGRLGISNGSKYVFINELGTTVAFRFLIIAATTSNPRTDPSRLYGPAGLR